MPVLYPKNRFKIAAILAISILFITNVATIIYCFDPLNFRAAEVLEATNDEISRAKLFIVDWYDELSVNHSNVKAFKNELQFEGGAFSLTVAKDRIRAVYPRGERYFQMEYITYLEFSESNGSLLCQMFYKTGETNFNIN